MIKNASYESLKNFIEKNIEKGSELVTDGWKSYKTIKGYKQTVVNSSAELERDTVLPNAHRIAISIKAMATWYSSNLFDEQQITKLSG